MWFRYSGDAGDALRYNGGNTLWYQNGMKFSTTDIDNDFAPYSCANDLGGGCWYNYCCDACTTCDGGHTQWDTIPGNYLVNLPAARMIIKPQ